MKTVMTNEHLAFFFGIGLTMFAALVDMQFRYMRKQMDDWRDAVLDSLDEQFKAQVADIEKSVIMHIGQSYFIKTELTKPLEYPNYPNSIYPSVTECTKNNAEKLKTILDSNKPKGEKNPPNRPSVPKPSKKSTGKAKK